MTNNPIRFPRHLLVGCSCSVIAIILATGLALFTIPHFPSPVFAATMQPTAGMTCAQAPIKEHCDHQDPELQGCAADARTIAQAEIMENGFPIGRVERRWSAKCQSWWGRVFDHRIGSHANMYITVAGTMLSAPPTFVSTYYRILYSSMVFDATPMQQVPAITGMLSIDGITPPATATLPAIDIPGYGE